MRDDFWGKAEHEWRLVHRPTGFEISVFEGEEYWTHWTGVKDVRFGEDGRTLIVTSVNPAVRDISQQRTDEERFELPAPPLDVDLPCARCGQPACTFSIASRLKPREGPPQLCPEIQYSGVLGKTKYAFVGGAKQQEELERIIQAGDAVAINQVVRDAEWRELNTATGSKRKEHFDAFCVQCQAVYCKDHYRIESKRGPRNNIVTQRTCPKGHVQEMDDGT